MSIPSGRLLWPLLLALFYAWQTHQQIGIWRSNVTLWTHAATIAPYKPRVLTNYGLALLQQGDTKGAVEQWRKAVQMADLPHVPPWDRRITNRDVAANMKALRGVMRK